MIFTFTNEFSDDSNERKSVFHEKETYHDFKVKINILCQCFQKQIDHFKN